jgi:hypothetical protein
MKEKENRKMRKNGFILVGLLLIPLCLFSQTQTVFVNTGAMHVGHSTAATDTALAVFGSIENRGAGVTTQESVTVLTGSFYHDANSHAFSTDAYGWGTSTGTIAFKEGATPTPGLKRYITTSDLNTFDRSVNYAAFPKIQIDTNDTLVVPSRMGLDALSVALSTGRTGVMLLKSTEVGGQVYDASLRISGNLVTPGSVAIERDLSLYRGPSQPLFAFASPMVNLRSGYFAGNWVRKMLTGANNHVQYVYGNKPSFSDPDLIDIDQYLKNAFSDTFVPGEGYLVRPRPSGFSYADLVANGGLASTNAALPSLYDKNKFVFNGDMYGASVGPETVFAANELISPRILSTPLNNTVNWVIGNSWTSAISVDSLIKVINMHPDIYFESIIYVFPSGTTSSYIPYYLPAYTPNGSAPSQVIPGLKAIPSQSLFMIRVLSDAQARAQGAPATYLQHGTFKLEKRNLELDPAHIDAAHIVRSLQVHDNTAHNTVLRSSNAEPVYTDEVLFKITPESNPNIFDLAAISLRQNTQEAFDIQDTEKIYLPGNDAFSLYSLSTDNRKLINNAVPTSTRSVKLCLEPGIVGDRLTLTASRTESLRQIWLEDLLTHQIIDLKQQGDYTFDVSPQDIPNRFVVYFNNAPTGIETASENFLQCYYSSGELVVKGLLPSDLNETIAIFDTQGRVLKKTVITQTPELHIPFSLANGFYVAKLQGKRTVTVKFLKSSK